MLNHVRLLVTPWTVTHQAPLSGGFPSLEYWSGLSFPPGYRPDPGIEPRSPALQADSLPLSHQGGPYEIEIIIKEISLVLAVAVFSVQWFQNLLDGHSWTKTKSALAFLSRPCLPSLVIIT